MMLATLLLLIGGGPGTPAATAPAPRPRLVVMITGDMVAPAFLDRWRGQLRGGLGRLLAEGAVFTDAHQDHALTETAPGHASVLSGRWPSHTGIQSNELGVSDSTAPLVEVVGSGASPRRFRGTALFDWLKAADSGARALSVSRKDRGAILPVGRAREQVYWYQSGVFTTSRYYADSLPNWVRVFNARRVPFKAAGMQWTLLLPDSAYPEPDAAPWENGGQANTFPHRLPPDSVRAAGAFTGVPWIDSLTLAFALTGVDELRLGRRRSTDLLAVSLSGSDAIGHTYGPDSREVHDQILRLDRWLGAFLERLEDRVGKGDILVVLSADHGVTPYPAAAQARGARTALNVGVDTLVDAVNHELDAAYHGTNPERWVSLYEGVVELHDDGRLAAAGITLDSVWTALAARFARVPGVARVDRPQDLVKADTSEDAIARRWIHLVGAGNTTYPLVVTLSEGSVWLWSQGRYASHGSPHDSDTHVPLILWGPGVKRGTYGERVATVDIAPTLARLLGLAPRSVVDGRVLTAALGEH